MTNPTTIGRGRSRTRRTLLTLTTILCSGLAAPALAQSPHPNLDANGIDLTVGTYELRLPVASIGSGQSELAVIAYDGQQDNWSNIVLYQSTSGGVMRYSVTVGTSSDVFTSIGGTSLHGSGATLTAVYDTLVYRTLDGVEIVFANPAGTLGGHSNLCDANNTSNCYLLPATISGRSGMDVTLTHDLLANCTGLPVIDEGQDCDYTWRLASVANSAGYAVVWSFAGDTQPNWQRRIGATLLNGATTVGTIGYANPSLGVNTITTPGGKTWRITGSTLVVSAVRRPGASSDTTVITRSGGQITAVTRDGVTTNYNRSVSGTVGTMTVTNALAQTTTIVSDLSKYRPTAVTDPLGRTTTMSYDAVGRPLEIVYPEGNKLQYSYDARGNLTTTTQVAKPGSGLASIVTGASYAATCVDATCNQPLSTTDARGAVTDYGYDSATGLPTSVTAPAATPGATRAETRYTYTTNAAGFSVLTGVSTCRTGAAPACVGTADEVQQTLVYDAIGNPVAVTVAAGDSSVAATVTRSYDAAGNLIAEDGPLADSADTTSYVWTADREPAGAISADPDGAGALPRQAVRTSYNAAGQPTVTEAGTVTGASLAGFVSLQQATASYDGNARQVATTLTAGGTPYAVTQYGYDALGRGECVAQRMNPATWGALPASACTLGAAGSFGPDRIVHTVYDAAGQVVKQQRAYGTADQADEATASYNPNGTLAALTDAEGNRTSYGYDGFDRLATTSYPSLTKGAETSSTTDYEQLGYDTAGQVTSRRLRDGNVLGYGYDALGRLTVKTIPDGGALPAATTRDVYYGYELTGALAFARFDSTGGEGVSASWNALGQMTSTTSTMGGTSRTLAYQYDAAGARTRITHPDGVYFATQHDVLGRDTLGQWWAPATGTVQFQTIGYDDQGRRTHTTRASSATGYGYDPAGRLTGLSQNFVGGTGNAGASLGYNPAGQIAAITQGNDAFAWPGAANADVASTHNGLNQPAALTHDANGNVTSDGTLGYGYDRENRLVSASNGTDLRYDPLGRLDTITKAGTTTRFLHDADHVVAEYDAAGTMQRRYLWGPGADEPLLQDEGSAMNCTASRFLHTDERGSIVATADCYGNRTGINRYDEYGNPASGNWGRFQYTGQMWLPELGLYYYKARMYSPTGPRFMQTDPIGYGDGLNWYNYVGGDPINRTDPSGTCLESDRRSGPDSCGEGKETARSYVERYYGRLSGADRNQLIADVDSYLKGQTSLESIKAGFIPGMGGYYGTTVYVTARPTSTDWTTLNFVQRFYSGNGASVDLGAVGLGDDFRNSPSVTGEVRGFVNEVRRSFKPNTRYSSNSVTNVTDVKSLFSVGHSTFFRSASCGSFQCTFSFSIQDRFIDPLGKGMGQLFGTPYGITYGWTETWRFR